MKKMVYLLILGVFILSAVTTQAATIYDKDGLTFKIKGDWQIQLRQEPGTDEDLDVEYDDLEIKNSVKYKLNDVLSAFGELDFGFKDAADKSNDDKGPHLEEAYVGFGFKNVKILFGKADSAADEFGIQDAKEEPVLDDMFDEFGAVDGDDLIKISATIADIVTIVASHEIDADSEKSDGNGTFSDIFVSAEFSGFTVGAAYQTFEEAPGEDGVENDSIDFYGVSLAYDAKVVEVAADYSVNADDDTAFYNAYVAVPIKPVKIGAGYQFLDYDTEDEEDVSGWYANVTYKFPSHKNVSIFAEVAGTDEDDSDMGYLVGARIKF